MTGSEPWKQSQREHPVEAAKGGHVIRGHTTAPGAGLIAAQKNLIRAARADGRNEEGREEIGIGSVP